MQDKQSCAGRFTLDDWADTARYWDRHQETIRTMFAGVNAPLLTAAGCATGSLVLDIGGGTGEPSLAAAATVGHTGMVVCTDPASDMLVAARRAALAQEADNIGFVRCVAEALPFATESFDCVLARLSAMFFSTPELALGEVLRVLANGGRAAIVVWGSYADNPFFTVVREAVLHHIELPPIDEDQAGPFRYAAEGKLARLLESVGAADVWESTVDVDIRAPFDPPAFWAMRSETSAALRNALAPLDPDARATLDEDVIERLAPLFVEGRLDCRGRFRLVSARRAT
jgi:SAM-dependent methyltransferase